MLSLFQRIFIEFVSFLALHSSYSNETRIEYDLKSIETIANDDLKLLKHKLRHVLFGTEKLLQCKAKNAEAKN